MSEWLRLSLLCQRNYGSCKYVMWLAKVSQWTRFDEITETGINVFTPKNVAGSKATPWYCVPFKVKLSLFLKLSDDHLKLACEICKIARNSFIILIQKLTYYITVSNTFVLLRSLLWRRDWCQFPQQRGDCPTWFCYINTNFTIIKSHLYVFNVFPLSAKFQSGNFSKIPKTFQIWIGTLLRHQLFNV